ncbi:helix-turn-helix domain-containing protein [Pseudosporangium ferrugineum]|uniref:Transcriptional regulator with XRE-family HTH domain n=1 Tax=Pseudosporangium ferrugineum TaxID=439699 RepID=A0A2T0SDA9_9ACTN|nr:helix-turn-helix transcriptional regulator [Pseudosporangium ferrugineum]PRY31410.1 transcriptional regulator with XRE-family HTH domain [Pseudosporangium ferrugineum]
MTGNPLGEFLKARRASVRPDEAGLPAYGRRRVPGLRRDELARIAGVSPHYLMRLEQGRDRHPSPQILDALARALRLDPDARAHLHALARPPVRPPGRPIDVRALLDAWPGTPAYVRDGRFEIRAANKLATALSPMYSPGRNLVRDVFLDADVRRLFPGWPDIAAQTVAALRAAADPADPALERLVADLSGYSDFRRLWARHDVRPSRDELKRFDHPIVGPLELRRQSLAVSGTPGDVIIVYQAEPGSPSADALLRL